MSFIDIKNRERMKQLAAQSRQAVEASESLAQTEPSLDTEASAEDTASLVKGLEATASHLSPLAKIKAKQQAREEEKRVAETYRVAVETLESAIKADTTPIAPGKLTLAEKIALRKQKEESTNAPIHIKDAAVQGIPPANVQQDKEETTIAQNSKLEATNAPSDAARKQETNSGIDFSKHLMGQGQHTSEAGVHKVSSEDNATLPLHAPSTPLSFAEKVALRKQMVQVQTNATSSMSAPKEEAAPVAVPAPSKPLSFKEKMALRNKPAPEAIAPIEGKVELQPTLGIKGAPQVRALETNLAANRQIVILNEKQKEAVELAKQGSMVLIGPAGTGKTTSVREVMQWLLAPQSEGGYAIPRTADFKKQNGNGTQDRITNQPRIVVASFTKRAVTNIKNSCIQSMPELKEAEWCFQSLHNAAEYAPEYYEDINAEGDIVNKMRFSPLKGPHNLIDVDYLIVEEASMVDINTLWANIYAALPSTTKVIFLGDICQLPPVFGLSVLIYAMCKLPVVELTEVYRQGMGPVLRGAHEVLAGRMPKWEDEGEKGALQLYLPWEGGNGKPTICNAHKPKAGREMSYGESKLNILYENLFKHLFTKGIYDPEQDIILSPFNKGELGTTYLNKGIAQFIGDARKAEVHEILAGYEKHYLAVGDKVMVDKQDGLIIDIKPNVKYMGSQPQPSGTDLTRFGSRVIGAGSAHTEMDLDDYANFSLEALANMDEEEAGARAASHVVTVMLETGIQVNLATKGDLNGDSFSLGYCLTGHKAQGSEWRNVYMVMHKRHHTLLSREWFYTCLTRAKNTCTILANTYSVEKAISTQRIPGNTLEEKLAWFTKDCTDIAEAKVCPC